MGFLGTSGLDIRALKLTQFFWMIGAALLYDPVMAGTSFFLFKKTRPNFVIQGIGGAVRGRNVGITWSF
jgi:hypothetical protein